MIYDLTNCQTYRLPEDAFIRFFGRTRTYDPNFTVKATRVPEAKLIDMGINPDVVMLDNIYSID